jgi:hypothetical protein
MNSVICVPQVDAGVQGQADQAAQQLRGTRMHAERDRVSGSATANNGQISASWQYLLQHAAELGAEGQVDDPKAGVGVAEAAAEAAGDNSLGTSDLEAIDWQRVLAQLKHFKAQDASMYDGPAAKMQRMAYTPPPRSQLSAANAQALQEILQMQQPAQQQQDTCWQRALAGVQFYLNSSAADSRQPAQHAAAGGPFPPFSSLSTAEQHALKQLLEPVRQAEVAKLRQQIARLQGANTAGPVAASAGLPPLPTVTFPASLAGPQAAAAAVPASLPGAHASTSGAGVRAQSSRSSGTPPTADVDAALHAAAAAAEQGAATDVSGAPGTAAVKEEQGLDLLTATAAEAWAGEQADEQAWSAWPWLALQQQQQQWMMMAGSEAQGGAGGSGAAGSMSTGSQGFSLRSAQYVGVYRSRRAEQGWRAQFSFANKVWCMQPVGFQVARWCRFFPVKYMPQYLTVLPCCCTGTNSNALFCCECAAGISKDCISVVAAHCDKSPRASPVLTCNPCVYLRAHSICSLLTICCVVLCCDTPCRSST